MDINDSILSDETSTDAQSSQLSLQTSIQEHRPSTWAASHEVGSYQFSWVQQAGVDDDLE